MNISFKNVINNTILKPKWVKYCSQTLYETLSFCNNMYIITNDILWKTEGLDIIEKIRQIQLNDGGFDIGYEFNFGRIHKKGWASAPENKMLVSLINFGSLFGFEYVSDIVDKAINWIICNSIKLLEDKWIIPYCPMATTELMVYNGISFSLAPLAMYYTDIEKNKEIKKIHEGYINFLYDEFEWDNGYWKYFDQSVNDLSGIQIDKVDNYHLAQQLEMHCYSYDKIKNSKNRAIIDKLSLYLLNLHFKSMPEPMPYINNFIDNKNDVHIWGYASVINGFLSYYNISGDKKFFFAAKEIFEWINKFSRVNDHYICIYNNNIDKRFYPRSDSWIINNLSNFLTYCKTQNQLNQINKTYLKIKKQDFSGIENHAMTKRNQIIYPIYNKIIRGLK